MPQERVTYFRLFLIRSSFLSQKTICWHFCRYRFIVVTDINWWNFWKKWKILMGPALEKGYRFSATNATNSSSSCSGSILWHSYPNRLIIIIFLALKDNWKIRKEKFVRKVTLNFFTRILRKRLKSHWMLITMNFWWGYEKESGKNYL